MVAEAAPETQVPEVLENPPVSPENAEPGIQSDAALEGKEGLDPTTGTGAVSQPSPKPDYIKAAEESAAAATTERVENETR